MPGLCAIKNIGAKVQVRTKTTARGDQEEGRTMNPAAQRKQRNRGPSKGGTKHRREAHLGNCEGRVPASAGRVAVQFAFAGLPPELNSRN